MRRFRPGKQEPPSLFMCPLSVQATSRAFEPTSDATTSARHATSADRVRRLLAVRVASA
jgi:hypothetical protein